MRKIRFTFVMNEQEQEKLIILSEKLNRRKSDAIRYLINHEVNLITKKENSDLKIDYTEMSVDDG